MRPLTDTTPKPLLSVGGKPLIVWHLERLAAAGFHDIVINHAHLGEQMETVLGDGAAYGVRISYSPEPPGALETAGGIANAMPLLGNDPFLVVNGDIYCDWDFTRANTALHEHDLAHLVMVNNPAHHPAGDFVLEHGKLKSPILTSHAARLTFSGIGIYRPQFFASIARGTRAKLAPLLTEAMLSGKVSSERHTGRWEDIGTPQRLAELDAALRSL